MEDYTSVGNALEICQSGRNEGPTVVVMDESSKSSSCHDGEEQIGNHLVANEEAIKIPAKNDGHVEKFGKDRRYPKRERHPPGKWWKNHILPQHGEKRPMWHCWMIL